MDFVETQAVSYPELAVHYTELGELHAKRLWHQLTEKLSSFAALPEADRGDNLLQLYENFISFFESKLNQLQLILLCVSISRQYTPSSPPVGDELDRAAAFLDKFVDKRGRIGDEAWVVAKLHATSLRLKKGGDEIDTAKRVLEETKDVLDGLKGADPIVKSTFHRVAAEYYKVVGPASSFFDAALQYLAHTHPSTLSEEEGRRWAVDIALAAVVGDGVYNFGEIVAHPVLASLEGTDDGWLGGLLKAFQDGDIDGFNTIVAENKAAYDGHAVLSGATNAVREKITLLCVMELVASKPAADRKITFAEIAAATRLELDQVEWLLMRGMSLELIKGSIDQVAGEVSISYVRPRVLYRPQIERMQERFATWGEKVAHMSLDMEQQTEELFT